MTEVFMIHMIMVGLLRKMHLNGDNSGNRENAQNQVIVDEAYLCTSYQS